MLNNSRCHHLGKSAGKTSVAQHQERTGLILTMDSGNPRYSVLKMLSETSGYLKHPNPLLVAVSLFYTLEDLWNGFQ